MRDCRCRNDLQNCQYCFGSRKGLDVFGRMATIALMRRAPLALPVVLGFALVGDHVILAQNPPCRLVAVASVNNLQGLSN